MPLILLFIQYSFNAQHVSAVNTTIFRSLRLTGFYFMGGIWFGACWRSVSVWLWRCSVFMQSEALLILLYIQYSFNIQHVSAVNTTIFRSLRLTGFYFMGCIWFGVCWRSVSVWLWRCGVFMQSEAVVLQTA